MAGTSQAGSSPPVIAGWRSRAARWLALRMALGAQALLRLALSWTHDAVEAPPARAPEDDSSGSLLRGAPEPSPISDAVTRGHPPAHWLEYVRQRSPALYEAFHALESEPVAPAASHPSWPTIARRPAPVAASHPAQDALDVPPSTFPVEPGRSALPQNQPPLVQDRDTGAQIPLVVDYSAAPPDSGRASAPSSPPQRAPHQAPLHEPATVSGPRMAGPDEASIVNEDPLSASQTATTASAPPAAAKLRRPLGRPVPRLFVRPAGTRPSAPPVPSIPTTPQDQAPGAPEPAAGPSEWDPAFPVRADMRAPRPSFSDTHRFLAQQGTTPPAMLPPETARASLVSPRAPRPAKRAPLPFGEDRSAPSYFSPVAGRSWESPPEDETQEPTASLARQFSSVGPGSTSPAAEPWTVRGASSGPPSRRLAPSGARFVEPPLDPWPALADSLAFLSDSDEIADRLARQADARRSKLDREQKGLLWNE